MLFLRDVLFLFLVGSVFMFCCGLFALLVNARNYLRVVFCLEILFVSVSVFYIVLALYTGFAAGFVMAIILITLAAVEAAVSLSILLNIYHYRYDIKTEHLFFFKG